MVILGIDNAGKTTLLEQLKTIYGAKGLPLDRIPPTIGFNIGRIQVGQVMAVFWDLGGSATFRTVWHNYYSEVQGIIFVIDSADPTRMEEAKTTMVELLDHEHLRSVPLLLFANKQDKPGALDIKEISRIFDIEILLGDRRHHVLQCSALKGEGLEPGVRWLLEEAGRLKQRTGQGYL